MLTPSRFLVPILLVAGMTACQQAGSRISFTVDNPTATPLETLLDGKPLKLAPHTGQDVALAPGAHTLSAPATGTVSFVVYAGGRGGLINPTLSPYILVNEIYATDAKSVERFRPSLKTLNIQGVSFSGPLALADGLFIDKTWQFGVHESLPDRIRVGLDSHGNIQGKIYDLDAFVAYEETMTQRPGRFARERQAEPPRRFSLEIPSVPAPSGPADWDAQLAPLRSAAQRYLKATTAKEQRALQQEYQRAVLGIATFTAHTASRLPGEENKRRDAEFRALVDLFSHSALPVGR